MDHDDPALAGSSAELGRLLLTASNSLTTECLLTHNPSTLQAALALAISALHQSKDSLPPSAYHYISHLHFLHYSKITHNTRDLLEAIARLESPGATPLPPALERRLSDYYTTVYSLESPPELLFPAIEHGYLALRCTPPQHPSYGRRLQTLAYFHDQRSRAYAGGAEGVDPGQDLDLAIKFASAALRMKKKPKESRREVLEAIGMYKGKGAAGRPSVNSEKEVGEQEDEEQEEEEEEEEEDHSARYGLRKSSPDLDLGIAHAEEAFADSHSDSGKRLVLCDRELLLDSGKQLVLGELLNDRYELRKDPNDLTIGIELITAVLDSTPSNHPNALTYLWKLCRMHKERYRRFRCEDDLQTALGHGTILTTVTGPEWVQYPDFLLVTAWLLGQRFELKEERGDIDRAIEMCKEGLLLARGREVEYRQGWLLWDLLHRRFRRLGDMADIDSIIHDAETELSKLVPGSDEHRKLQMELRGYQSVKRNRWGPAGRAEWEEDYRALQQEAADLIESQDPGVLAGLSTRFWDYWKNTLEIEALNMAITYGRSGVEAIDGTDEADIWCYTVMFGNLGTYLEERSAHLNSLDDLEEAIEMSAREMSLTPDKPSTLQGLCCRLIRRSVYTGSEFDLDAAIATATLAAAQAPAPHRYRPNVLCVLSEALDLRHDRTGDPADLESAVTAAQEALDLTPPGVFSSVNLFVAIGNITAKRYNRTGALRDLNLSMELAEAAVKACPCDRPEYATLLIDQSKHLVARYQRLFELADLERALVLTEQGLAVMPWHQPERNNALYTQSNIHMAMHAHAETSDPTHLLKAIEGLELCEETLPPEHLNHAALGITLARARLQLYKRHTHEDNDLGRAIECAQAAFRVSAPLVAADAQRTLAACLLTAGTEESVLRATQAYIQGWESALSRPSERVHCARRAAGLLGDRCMWEEASNLADAAVMLLPRVSPRSLERNDQQEGLASMAGLGAKAAALALQAGKGACHALRMLEFGRGLMLGYVIDNRSDMSDLGDSHPALANRFEVLRRALDAPVQEEDAQAGALTTAAGRRHYGMPKRHRLVDDMDRLLDEIRGIQGYEGFLLPPDEQEMMKLAASGPVVVVNHDSVRSDAIIITSTEIRSLSLPKLSTEKGGGVARRLEKMQDLVKGPPKTIASRKKKMGTLLLLLWNVVVEPILEELQMMGPPPELESDATLPHIWWIGVGALSTAPFHAAGDHSPGSTRNTISRVVSSYIPTLKALSYARQKAPATNLIESNSNSNPGSQQSLLLVTMPTTPDGCPPLGWVTQEAANIAAIRVGAGAKTTVLPQPSASHVLDELQRYDAIHFACHGVTDSADPSKSALLLMGEDGKSVDRLRVEDVAAVHTQRAKLAYLSACSTADRGQALYLADETIHLAGAFQLAGFAHVVATMWTSGDQACMEVAEDFYKGLYRVGGRGDVGREVHAAVRRFRETKPDKYLLWAPFIHTGP